MGMIKSVDLRDVQQHYGWKTHLLSTDDIVLYETQKARGEELDKMTVKEARELHDRLVAERGRLMGLVEDIDRLRGEVGRSVREPIVPPVAVPF